MSTNEPMTTEQLDEIQKRADESAALQLAVPGDTQRIALYHSDDVEALIVEVKRLQAPTTVTDEMVERAARESWGQAEWDGMLASNDDYDVAYAQEVRVEMRNILNAALNTKKGS